ncbi:MAG: 16S rRNA (guanine(527)-N(7))-methyltransferase RsmG, partial [Bacilli bacterium]|nr:16S rRNA (guanine(527)-N(7))-methyltransferase RsmG [Bacilli bacterium]
MDRQLFIDEVKKLNIDLTDNMLEQLNRYYELLVEWNSKINLTAITEKNEVYLKHFYDSLTLCKVIDLNNEESLCDIGTGAGFPGIVLKICFPHLKLTLVDALNKRINFLKLVCEELGLDNVECIHARAEEYALKNRNLFDIVTARAVAPLNVLLEYSIPLVKVSKYFIALKGIEDITESKNALKILNCNILMEEKFLLP